MPAYNSLEAFLSKVCEQIRYRGADSEIKEELKAHIENHAQSLIDCGWDNKSAISKAVESMGDPVQIGKTLNRIHKPYIEWLVLATNIIIVILSFHLSYILASNAIRRILPIDIGVPNEQIKYEININQKDIIDDRTVVIKKLVMDVVITKDFEFGRLFLCKYDKWFSCNTVINRYFGLLWYPGNQVYGKLNDTSLPIDYNWHGSRYQKDYMLWMVYGIINDESITSIKLEVELDGQTIILDHPQLYDDMFLFTWNSMETDYKLKKLIGLDDNSKVVYKKEFY